MARQKYVARMLAISLVAVALMAVAVYIKRNLSHRLRMEEQERINGSLRSQLEIERYQRQFLAISLASEDTDRSLADIRQRLDDLRKDGKISEEIINQRVDEILDVILPVTEAVKKYEGKPFDIEAHHKMAAKALEQFHCSVDIITYDTGFAARLSGKETIQALFLENYMATKQNLSDIDSLKKLMNIMRNLMRILKKC